MSESMEAPDIAAARQAVSSQASSMEGIAASSERLVNDMLAGGMSSDQATMSAIADAQELTARAAAAWQAARTGLAAHAQGEEYASSGIAAKTEYLRGDAGVTAPASHDAQPPAPAGPGTTRKTTMSQCPSWCKGLHSAGPASHTGEGVEVGGEQEESWHSLIYLTTEDLTYRNPDDGTAKVGLELSDGDGNSLELSISLSDARKLSLALANLAKAGHLG